jgi:uncharacterized protein (TIGR03067 family)
MRLFLAMLLSITVAWSADEKPKDLKAKPVEDKEDKEKPMEKVDDTKAIVGTWKLVSLDLGPKIPAALPPGWGDIEYVFDDKGNAVMLASKAANMKGKGGKFKLDPKAKLKTMEIEFNKDDIMKSLYELDGDQLRLCLKQEANAGYPKVFAPDVENKTLVFILQRSTKNEEKKDK